MSGTVFSVTIKPEAEAFGVSNYGGNAAVTFLSGRTAPLGLKLSHLFENGRFLVLKGLAFSSQAVFFFWLSSFFLALSQSCNSTFYLVQP